MPGEFYTGIYDQKLDVFSFGLTLNEIYNGKHGDKHPIKIIQKSPVFLNLITLCVEMSPNKRPTSKYIKAYLKFFRFSINDILFNKKNQIQINYLSESQDGKDSIFIHLHDFVNEKILCKKFKEFEE